LIGAPEMVVEILSPSNSAPKLKQYRRLCLENGTLIFLTVDDSDHTIEVHLKGENTARTWTAGEEIPVDLWGERKSIAVDDIFGGGIREN
jgi:Uma2 family endonuclease